MAELECRQLSRSFGPVRALEGVTLAAEPGRILGLLGPNGSGKTTLIKLANGLLRPSGGEILVCGAAPGPETRAQVSYMPERLCLPEWMSVERIAAFYADFYADFDAARAGELLARLGIDGKRRLRQLSKGARQKVQLALVMSRRRALPPGRALRRPGPGLPGLHAGHYHGLPPAGGGDGDLDAHHLGC